MGKNITVIEFSLSNVKIIYGYFLQDKVYVLQSLESSNLPLDENGLLARKETTNIVTVLLDKIKEQTKNEIDMVIPLYPPFSLQIKQTNAGVTTTDSSSRVTPMDFVNCCNMIIKNNSDIGRQIIYNEPYKFKDDYKREYIDFPINVQSDHLYVNCFSQLIDANVYEHYRSIINDLNLNVYFELCIPCAASMFINSFDAPSNYIALDIDRDYMSISRIANRHLIDNKFFKYGINNVISNAAKVLNVEKNRAEELLNFFGLFDNSQFNYETPEKFNIQKINDTFKLSLNSLTEYINNYLNITRLPSDVPIILHGIGGDINGIISYLQHKLSKTVKLFSPLVIGARSKSYVSTLGALLASSFSYQINIKDARRVESNVMMNKKRIYREE